MCNLSAKHPVLVHMNSAGGAEWEGDTSLERGMGFSITGILNQMGRFDAAGLCIQGNTRNLNLAPTMGDRQQRSRCVQGGPSGHLLPKGAFLFLVESNGMLWGRRGG